MRDSMSEAQREAMTAILDDLYAQQVEMIANGRGEIDTALAADLIDQGPFTAEEAYQAKLVDAIQYYDELVQSTEERAEEKAEVVSEYGKKSTEAPRTHRLCGFHETLLDAFIVKAANLRDGKTEGCVNLRHRSHHVRCTYQSIHNGANYYPRRNGRGTP